MPSSEAERLIKDMFEYARARRESGTGDFGEIMAGFRKRLVEEGGVEGNFSKRFLRLIKEFLATDPRYQKKLELEE